MLKIIKFTAISFLVMLIILPCKHSQAYDDINLYVDDMIVEIESFVLNERVMLPAEELEKILDIQIKMDSYEHKLLISKVDSIDIFFVGSMQIGESFIALQDDEYIYIDTPAVEIGDVIYVPLRYVCYMLGFTVHWNEENRTVYIDSQSFDDLGSSEYKILDDKLRISLPTDTLKSPNSIFIYPKSELFIIRRNTEIQVIAEELYLKSKGNLEDNICDLGYDSIREYYNVNDLVVALVKLEGTVGDALTAEYIVRISDGYLFKIKFQVSTDYNENKDEILRLINNSIKTIAQGNTVDYLSAKTYELDELSINVPKGYYAYKSYGIDFYLWNIGNVKDVGENQSKLLIYLGQNPDYLYNMKHITVFKSVFLGNQLDWSVSCDGNLESLYKTGDGLCFHLLIIGNDENEIKQLLDIVERIHFADVVAG